MGLHQLNLLDRSDFFAWVKRSGYTDEKDFWQSLSGIEGSVTDCMVSYLSSLGYSGQPSDMFRDFLKDQVGLVGGLEGTLFDMANEMFDGTFSTGGGADHILTEGGDTLTTEGGDAISLE